MFVGFRFVIFCPAITFFLPCITIGTTMFKTTPKDEVRFVGEDIVLNWTYIASSRDTDFKSYSPKWNFYDVNNSHYQLAREDKSKSWAWEIVTDSCPRRLLHPVQRIFKFESGEQYSAALNITNLTLADSGTYECQLGLLLRTLTDQMNLTVKVRPPVTTAIPTTTPSAASLNKTHAGNFKILMHYNEELKNDESDTFKELNAKISNMFSSVYQSNFISLDIKKFVKGSVIVNFEVTLYIVSEPFELLKKALEASGGTLHGLKIDPESIKEGHYTPPTGPPAPPAGGLDTGAIIGIVIGVLAVIIVIVVIVVWLVKRGKKNAKKGLRIPMTE